MSNDERYLISEFRQSVQALTAAGYKVAFEIWHDDEACKQKIVDVMDGSWKPKSGGEAEIPNAPYLDGPPKTITITAAPDRNKPEPPPMRWGMIDNKITCRPVE